jgi:hypothetical protein
MMLRILGAPRRVRVAVGGMFVLSAVLVSIGVANVAGASLPNSAPAQAGYTQMGYGQDGDQYGDNDKDHKSKSPTPIRTSKSPSPTPSKSKSMSPTPTPTKTESASPTASATVSPTAVVTTTASTLPVTGGSTAPTAFVAVGLLLSGLALLGARLFLARRT